MGFGSDSALSPTPCSAMRCLTFSLKVGGSLRIPAAYSGCFGIKCSGGRVAGIGARSSNPGFEAVTSCFGSMGRSVNDLEASVRVLLDASAKLSRTHAMLPVPYREVELPNKLKVRDIAALSKDFY